MTEDLIAWLRAQLDEDQRLAQWAVDQQAEHAGDSDFDPNWWFDQPDPTSGAESLITRFRPARVLVEVEAKRLIVEMHDKAGDCSICFAVWPCGTLRALALPYADQPGYREEWKP